MRVSPLLLLLALAATANAGDILIRGATVLPQSAPALEADVLLHDDRIVKIGPRLEAPRDALIIDAKGRFLIPGLIDVHAHIAEDKIFPDLFVPHGVTTVRDMGNRLELVQKLAADRSPTRPELVYVGPILDGQPPVWPAISEVLEKPEQVRPVLERLKAAGCRWFKVYENLRPEVYDEIIEVAKSLGVPVVGHVPQRVTALHCIESGQQTIEHLDHFAPAISAKDLSNAFTDELAGWNDVDPAKEKALIDALVKNETLIDPTRLVVKNYSLAMRGLTPDAPAARFVPKALRDTFWSLFAGTPRAGADVDAAHERSLAHALEFVKRASDAGVPILCGTDTPNPFVVPGASVPEEIVELAKALGPEKALSCATLANARALGRDDIGRIGEGARADLVLLREDPRKDAKAVASIEAVIVRGHCHDRKALDAKLAELEAKAKASDALPASGFESIAGSLSDRKPLGPERRFEGRLGTFATSFWVRLRAFEGPPGQRMTFLRASGSLPVPMKASETLVTDEEGTILRYHLGVESIGPRRETTIERREDGWTIQLFSGGEIRSRTTAPLDEVPSVQGELLLVQLIASLHLDEGQSAKKKLRFVDLDRMKVIDPVEWTVRREKNPITDAKDARSRGSCYVASSADAGQPRLTVWLAGSEPLGFEVALPFGAFVMRRVERRYY